ncbi:hypothetical protein [Microbacterium sp. Marseille-Q6965]|uniref:hypothetical protein n=1 Tax=Microbacterium sp. Marseille-Q6965 TaxID=2965072 RepID=UPI0021B784A6|nr:hypothetical protein [Microbacterium sp. Marseille-Q6965]
MSAVAAISGQIGGSSWAQGGAASFRTDFSSPGGIAGTIVGFALEYVWPLNEWLDGLVGDEGEVQQTASTWRSVSRSLDTIQGDIVNARNLLEGQEGRTIRAMRRRYDELSTQVEDAAHWTGAVAEAAELASQIVTAVHDAVVGALSELAGLVTDLFGFSLSLSSLNPFDRVEKLQKLADRAAYFIEMCGALIERMFSAFEQLIALLQALAPLIQKAMQKLAEFIGDIAPGLLAVAGSTLGAGVAGLSTLALTGNPLLAVLAMGPGALVGGAGGGLLGTAFTDLLSPDPRVTELHPDDLTADQIDQLAGQNAIGQEITSFSELIRANGLVDDLGTSGNAYEDSRSVVDIKKVLGPDGTYHYIVALPSTQDWNVLKGPMNGAPYGDTFRDYGATNDLDSNIALMLNSVADTGLETQYQRAVRDAMAQAGITDADRIVYTGFSQGGIAAATFASDPTMPGRPIGVVTNGSPIDTFDLPQGIPVYNFQHEGDIVPMLDLNPGGTQTTDQHQYTVPAHDGSTGPGTHSNSLYVDTVEETFDHLSDNHPELFGTVVDQQQYTWSE